MKLTSALQAEVVVPEDAFSSDKPLVAVMRGDHVGSLHRGSWAVAGTNGELIASLGESRQGVYLRSAAKPFQILPAILAGGIDRFGITDTELAVLCASHSGESRHLEAVTSVLEKVGLDESALQCGVHAPLNEQSARSRWRQGLEPSPVCNNCSGAHTGMLLACRANSWPIDGYGDFDHPLQKQTRAILAAFAGIQPQQIDLAMDNCHVPTFRLSLAESATAFARLVTRTGVAPELGQAANTVVCAMTAHPEMVAGEDRFDTDLMRATAGRMVSKGGAEGFQGVGVTGDGVGLALKVTDGNARAIGPAMIHLLNELGLLSAQDLDRLAQWHLPVTSDLKGTVAGRLLPIFWLANRE